jgi:D-3-phosphoglycerate dehydrogenase
MNFVLVVADRIGANGIELLRATARFDIVSAADSAEKLAGAIANADALLVRSSTKVTDDLMARAPKLKVIGRAGMGVDNIDVAAASNRGIAVLNTPGANTISAAEHTFALLLSLLRRIPWATAQLRQRSWDRQAFSGSELHGKTLGTLGLGRVGRYVVGLAQAFGMQVLAYDPFVAESAASELGVSLTTLPDVLQRSDAVTLHIPLTEDTRRIISGETLALMKPTAVLINTARGGLVDEGALLAALDGGKLAGAALDVFAAEPLAPDSPLRTCDKVVLTPHLAASTAEAQARVSLEICESVRRALVDGDVSGAVNREVMTSPAGS